LNFARLSTAAIGLAAIETYSCLTLSGFLAVSGSSFIRKQNTVFAGAKVTHFQTRARKL
jgi:hypothetical protein